MRFRKSGFGRSTQNDKDSKKGKMTALINITELAEVLGMEKSSLYKLWKEYPHVYVGRGRNARSARFLREDVLAFLRGRDYTKDQRDAISGRGQMGGASTGRNSNEFRVQKKKGGVQDKNRRQRVGKENKGRVSESTNPTPSCILDFDRKFGVH